MNPKVDAFISRAKKWREEYEKLRAICLASGLTEELKWGKPAYTFQAANILIIQGFKEYCALMFCKGALLKDAKGILTAPGENSQAARQARFTTLKEIVAQERTLKAYIEEAIAAEKAGLKVTFKKITEHKLPEELQTAFDKDPNFKTAFRALTPGRQRGYLLHVSGAKQSATRVARIEKCRPQILMGKGMND